MVQLRLNGNRCSKYDLSHFENPVKVTESQWSVSRWMRSKLKLESTKRVHGIFGVTLVRQEDKSQKNVTKRRLVN